MLTEWQTVYTLIRLLLDLGYSVYPGLSVRKLRIITVNTENDPSECLLCFQKPEKKSVFLKQIKMWLDYVTHIFTLRKPLCVDSAFSIKTYYMTVFKNFLFVEEINIKFFKTDVKSTSSW